MPAFERSTASEVRLEAPVHQPTANAATTAAATSPSVLSVMAEEYPRSGSGEQQNLQIADVRPGRPTPDQDAESIEQRVGVVVVERALHDAGRVRAERSKGVAVDEGPGGVGRTVDAIGAETRERGRGGVSERCERGERKFLVPSAAALPPHVDRRLATRDQAQGPGPSVRQRALYQRWSG